MVLYKPGLLEVFIVQTPKIHWSNYAALMYAYKVQVDTTSSENYMEFKVNIIQSPLSREILPIITPKW